jgi:hypothetical protein
VRAAPPKRSQGNPLLLAGVVLAGLLIGIAGTVARADDGTGLTVEVIASSATPTPTPTPTPTSTRNPSATATGSATYATTVGGVSTTEPAPTGTGTAGSGQSGTAGVIYVSGLSWTYTPSLNPLDGSLTLRFTVRNVFSQTLSPTASLWVNQVFGGTVGVPVTVAVDKLKPGETRVIEATFSGLAQWTVLTAHATLTIPGTVGEVVVAPIGRDAVVLFLPWFSVLIAGSVAGWFLWRRFRKGRVAAATPPPTGEDSA